MSGRSPLNTDQAKRKDGDWTNLSTAARHCGLGTAPLALPWRSRTLLEKRAKKGHYDDATMAPVLNIRVFRLDEVDSGCLQQNRPYSLEIGSVSSRRQETRGEKAGETAQLLVSEIVMCPQKNLVQYAYSGPNSSHSTLPPPALAQVTSRQKPPTFSFPRPFPSLPRVPSPKSASANRVTTSAVRPSSDPVFLATSRSSQVCT